MGRSQLSLLRSPKGNEAEVWASDALPPGNSNQKEGRRTGFEFLALSFPEPPIWNGRPACGHTAETLVPHLFAAALSFIPVMASWIPRSYTKTVFFPVVRQD